MLLVGLHAPRRYDPYAVGKIDFVPGCAAGFIEPRGRERDELQARGGDAAVLPELSHEGADLAVRQSGVVLDLGDLRARRQRVLEQATPACRIINCAIMVNGRPTEHVLDPPAHARCRLRRLLPNRLEHLEHERRVDRRDRERAERRIYEPDEASDPLLPVARARPACFIVLDEALGALLERHGPGVCGPKRGYARALGFDRIDAVETKQASLSRLLAGLGERERMNGAKAHIAVAGARGVAENPLL